MNAYIDGPLCIFECPQGVGTGKGKCSAQVKGADAPWKNEGTDDKPTLSPSCHCVKGCGWHGFIIDGKPIAMPVIQDAIATVSSLHVCEGCRKPEIVVVGLMQTADGIGVKIVGIDSRKTP